RPGSPPMTPGRRRQRGRVRLLRTPGIPDCCGDRQIRPPFPTNVLACGGATGYATSVREGQAMGHVYGKEFMDYAAASSRYAAEKIVHHLKSDLSPRSILDVGCAVGAWLDVWMQAGVSDVCGVDGDYVNRSQLLIPQDRFRAANLAETVDLGRRFDLAQS